MSGGLARRVLSRSNSLGRKFVVDSSSSSSSCRSLLYSYVHTRDGTLLFNCSTVQLVDEVAYCLWACALERAEWRQTELERPFDWIPLHLISTATPARSVIIQPLEGRRIIIRYDTRGRQQCLAVSKFFFLRVCCCWYELFKTLITEVGMDDGWWMMYTCNSSYIYLHLDIYHSA